MNEVVVTGMRQSMRDSVVMKQNSELISDNISTADIGQLPDVTIAEELNRLPGVNTTRDRGNASQAAVRGLGPRLVFGLVNGREVASSEPSQDLRWEIYPSEVLSGAQVYKSQDATLIPGGIAATIDIRTLSPLDYHGPTFTFRAGPTYNEGGKDLPHYDPKGYRGSAGYVAHITDDFAISLAASVQREKNGFPDAARSAGTRRTIPAATPATSTATACRTTPPGVWSPRSRRSCRTVARWPARCRLARERRLTIKADALWSQYEIKEDQFQAWYGNNITGNWANGNSGHVQRAGQFLRDRRRLGGRRGSQRRLPELRKLHQQLQRAAHAAGHRPECRMGSRHVGRTRSTSRTRRPGARTAGRRSIYRTSIRRTWPSTSGTARRRSASTPGFNPADPAIQSAGGFRVEQRLQRQRHAARATVPRKHATASRRWRLDFSRDFETPILAGLKFGARASRAREEAPSQPIRPVRRHGIHGLHHAQRHQLAGVPRRARASSISGKRRVSSRSRCRASLRRRWCGATSTTFARLVYPDDSVPAGSEQLLVHTDGQGNHLRGLFAKLDFKSELGGLPLTGGIGVRVAHLKTDERAAFRPPTT